MPKITTDATDQAAEAIRHLIVTGAFQPSARLPPRTTLIQRLKVSTITLQTAVERLEREGFLTTRPRAGTFVAARPPHSSRFALVTHVDPVDPERFPESCYFSSLFATVNRLNSRSARMIEIIYGIDRLPETPAYRHLANGLAKHLFAGVIFATSPHRLRNTPLLAADGVPRVAFMSRPLDTVAAISSDFRSFDVKALDYLAQRRRKKLAVLSHSGSPANNPEFLKAVRAHNMTTCEAWQIAIGRPFTAAANWIRLLWQLAPRTRPDALLVYDDNLAAPAMSGIVDAGIRVPDDLDVVSLCNFPYAGPSPIRIKWLGFDWSTHLQHAMRVIDQMRSGEKTAMQTPVPAVFDHERETEQTPD